MPKGKYERTDSTKEKQRQALKGRIPWNKGLKTGPQSEESKRKKSDSLRGRKVWNKGLTLSQEHCRKLSKAKIGKNGEKNNGWKGGCERTFHDVSWRSFGLKKCEVCGITNEQHKQRLNRRLSMHCRDKNYSNLTEENWVTVCEFGCHQKLDHLDRI